MSRKIYHKMPLSKVALMCLEASPFLKYDLFLERAKMKHEPRLRVTRRRGREPMPSVFETLYRRLRNDSREFFSMLHMSLETFDYVLEHVKEDLMQTDPTSRSPEEKLFITIRYLAGESINKIAVPVSMSRKLASKIIFATLNVIWSRLSSRHLRDPTPVEMTNLAREYKDKWNFPNCVGAIGGKYIRMVNVSLGIKQKVTLNAVVDANFRFLGAHATKKRNNCYDSFVQQIFKISGMQCLPGTEIMLPLVLIGNEAYHMKTNLMKPYAGKAATLCEDKKIFNERLKAARVPVDIALDILTDKWKVFNRPFALSLSDTRLVIKVACLLYNVIKDREGDVDPHFTAEGRGDQSFLYLNLVTNKSRKNNRSSSIAVSIRDQLKKYIREH